MQVLFISVCCHYPAIFMSFFAINCFQKATYGVPKAISLIALKAQISDKRQTRAVGVMYIMVSIINTAVCRT